MKTPRSGEATEHLLLVEVDPSGHRLAYVRTLVLAATRQGMHVTLAAPEDVRRRPEFLVHLADVEAAFDLVALNQRDKRLLSSLRKEVRADLTVIPDADKWLTRLAAVPRLAKADSRLNLLVMRDPVTARRSSIIPFLKALLKRLVMWVLSVRPGVRVCVLRSPLWSGKSNLSTVRDPISLTNTTASESELRSRWALHEDVVWFSVLGAIDPRKNLPTVLEALGAVDPTHRVGLIVAGSIDPDVWTGSAPVIEALRAQAVPLIVRDQLLADEELDSLVSISHCVVLAHSNEGPSGMLGKAAAAGTFILAAGAESLREDCIRIPSLARWVPLEAPRLAHEMGTLAAMTSRPPVLSCGSREFSRALLE